MDTNKELTKEELESLKEVNTRYNNLLVSVGELEISLEDANARVTAIKAEKVNLMADYSSLKTKSEELSNKLVEKYGPGRIDIETGKIESI